MAIFICLGNVLHLVSTACHTGYMRRVFQYDAISPVSIILTNQKHRWWWTIMIVRWSRQVLHCQKCHFPFPKVPMHYTGMILCWFWHTAGNTIGGEYTRDRGHSSAVIKPLSILNSLVWSVITQNYSCITSSDCCGDVCIPSMIQ